MIKGKAQSRRLIDVESKRAKREAEHQPDHDHSQKGTFFSVLMVGAFIVLTFVLMFGIYMSRV